MRAYESFQFDEKRMGNNADNEEWKVIKNWLQSGELKNKKEMQVCYNNMKKNKKWYYDMNFESQGIFAVIMAVGLLIASFVIGKVTYNSFMNSIVSQIVEVNGAFGTFTSSLSFGLNLMIGTIYSVIIYASSFKIFKKILFDRKIDNIQKSLEIGLGITFFKKKQKGQGKDLEMSSLSCDKNKKDSIVEWTKEESKTTDSSKSKERVEKIIEEYDEVKICTPEVLGDVRKAVALIKWLKVNKPPEYEEDITKIYTLTNQYLEDHFYVTTGPKLFPKDFKEALESINRDIQKHLGYECNQNYLKSVMTNCEQLLESKDSQNDDNKGMSRNRKRKND